MKRFFLLILLAAVALVVHHASRAAGGQKMEQRSAPSQVMVLVFHVSDATSQVTMAWGTRSLPDSITVELLDYQDGESSRKVYVGRPDTAAVAP